MKSWVGLPALMGAVLLSAASHASIISVSSNTSSLGASAQIIAAPTSVLDDAATNTAQQGFNEKQTVKLASDLNVESQNIVQGTVVDSHMLFFNTADSAVNSHKNVTWTFSGTILAVYTSINGASEAATNSLLGNPGTTYYPGTFDNRGLEGNDRPIDWFGNTLLLSMVVSEPGDWIRVVTDAPEPAILGVFGIGMLMVGGLSRRRQKRAL